MHPKHKQLNVPTWIIGSSLGKGALIDRAAEVLKVWPTLALLTLSIVRGQAA
jgi:hypothetical protein